MAEGGSEDMRFALRGNLLKPGEIAPRRFLRIIAGDESPKFYQGHLDTFDYKPLLAKYEGQRPDAVNLRTQRTTTGILKSPYKFARRGQSGQWVSELFPHVTRHIDDLCVIHSMHTDIPEHVSGLLMMDIGANQSNRPSMGSWITYGLGTENENLPGVVVLCHRGHLLCFARDRNPPR